MIDVVASQSQYAAHLDPVWEALPDELRGERTDRRSTRTREAVLVASGKDLATARSLGYSRIAYLEHGIGQSYGNEHASYPGGSGRGAVDLFLSPNETAAAADRAAYPSAHVELVGDPRLDTLPALSGPPRTVALSFHWDCYVAPETRSALPHYRSVIAELATRMSLIGHAHPRATATMQRFYGRLGIEFVGSFDEVCRRASLFVADNTSCLYEFASTGRPVLVLNAPWFRRDVELGLRFWAAAGVGLNVDEPGDLVALSLEAINDDADARRNREEALSIAYAFRAGAGARAAAAIVDWIRMPKRAAA